MTKKFNFREIVQLIADVPKYEDLKNTKGHISGVSQSDQGEWSYAVFMYQRDIVICFSENELKSTGQFVSKEETNPVARARVSVDSDGKGSLIDYEEYSEDD